MSQHTVIRLPHRPFLWRIARAAALVWVVLRVAVALNGLFLGERRLLVPGPGTALLLVGLAALLVWLALHRDGQHLFHANLGVSPAWSFGVALLAAGVLEAAAQLLSRLLIQPSGGAVLG